jgi:hypothetical protein
MYQGQCVELGAQDQNRDDTDTKAHQVQPPPRTRIKQRCWNNHQHKRYNSNNDGEKIEK